MNNKYLPMRLKAAVALLEMKWGRVMPLMATWEKSLSTIAGHLCLAFVTEAGEVRQEWI